MPSYIYNIEHTLFFIIVDFNPFFSLLFFDQGFLAQYFILEIDRYVNNITLEEMVSQICYCRELGHLKKI